MKMLEKMARELEPQAWAARGTGDTLAYRNRRVSSLRKAERVAKVMREPDEAMLRGCWPHHHPLGVRGPEYSPVAFLRMRELVTKDWRAMIDSILSEAKTEESGR